MLESRKNLLSRASVDLKKEINAYVKSAQQLNAASISSEEELSDYLYAAIFYQKMDMVTNLLKDSRITSGMLNRLSYILNPEVDLGFSYLDVATRTVPEKCDVVVKMAIVSKLFCAGASNINRGHTTTMGPNLNSPFMNACNPSLWPGLSREGHIKWARIFYNKGGSPDYMEIEEPCGSTARKLAEGKAPYLIEAVFPKIENSNGQFDLLEKR